MENFQQCVGSLSRGMWFRGFALQILKKLNFNRVPWLTRSRHMILGVWYLKIRKNIKNMLWNHGYYNSWLVSIIMSRVRLRVKIMVARSNVCWQKLWIVARNAKTSRVYPELKKTVAKRDRSIDVSTSQSFSRSKLHWKTWLECQIIHQDKAMKFSCAK